MTDSHKQPDATNPDEAVNQESMDSQEANQDQILEQGETPAGELSLSDEELAGLCKDRVCPCCPVKEEKDQEMIRVKADADNFRKRVSREKEQFMKYAGQELLEEMVPVIDNLELALEHGQKVEACKDLIQGVEMTRKIFLDSLKKHGLETIESEACQPFDPAWHEAMGEVKDQKADPGTICQVVQKGYALKGRVLRPAKVMLSKK